MPESGGSNGTSQERAFFTTCERGTTARSPEGDGVARIWDLESGKQAGELRESGEPAAIFAASYSPDGRYILTAGADGIARVWDAAGNKAPVYLQGHTAGL